MTSSSFFMEYMLLISMLRVFTHDWMFLLACLASSLMRWLCSPERAGAFSYQMLVLRVPESTCLPVRRPDANAYLAHLLLFDDGVVIVGRRPLRTVLEKGFLGQLLDGCTDLGSLGD
jgi:hypothetical protein